MIVPTGMHLHVVQRYDSNDTARGDGFLRCQCNDLLSA